MPSPFALQPMPVMSRRKLDGVSEASLSRFVSRAQRRAGVAGEVNVLITSSDELQRLNREYLGKNKPTDVLSFPSALSDGGGDIAISWQIAQQNAKSLGHSLNDELKVLILHGTLHLAGFDHENDRGEMQRLEQKLRLQLGLPQSLIERAGRTTVSRTSRKRAVGGGRKS